MRTALDWEEVTTLCLGLCLRLGTQVSACNHSSYYKPWQSHSLHESTLDAAGMLAWCTAGRSARLRALSCSALAFMSLASKSCFLSRAPCARLSDACTFSAQVLSCACDTRVPCAVEVRKIGTPSNASRTNCRNLSPQLLPKACRSRISVPQEL